MHRYEISVVDKIFSPLIHKVVRHTKPPAFFFTRYDFSFWKIVLAE